MKPVWILCVVALGARSPGAVHPWKPPYPAENLLPNSSFEQTSDAREVYPIIGEYRHRGAREWVIDADESRYGEQSLRMQGTTPFFWQVLGWDSKENVFSVYLKGSTAGQKVELGFELLSFVDDGAASVEGRERLTVAVSPEWQRYDVPSAIDRKREVFVRLHLFRAWVRPLSGDRLWVDAAQIEKGRTTPTEYKAERGYNELADLLKRSITTPIVTDGADEPAWQGKRSKSGKVRLTVRETSGVARDQEPAWGGVPFPPGELFHENAVQLYTEDGTRVPCQTQALARRHVDGSITSLLVDVQVSLPANRNKTYELRYGGASDRAAPNGTTRWGRVPPVACLAQHLSGETFSSEQDADAPSEVEIDGPLRRVTRTQGKHRTTAGDTFLDYELRIHEFAGKPYVLVEGTLENREVALNTPVRAAWIQLLAQPNETGVSLGMLEREPTTLGEHTTATQLHNYYGAGGYDLVLDGKSPRVLHGVRADGRLVASKTEVRVLDWHERNPKALAATTGAKGVRVYHWPAEHVRFADLPFGMSNTMRLFYARDGRVPTGQQLRIQVDPAWVSKTGVFGRWLTEEQAQAHCPRLTRRVNDYFAALVHDRDILDLTGTFDYGDFGQPCAWMNNETCASQHLWVQYLRMGDPALFRRAEAMSLHTRDVDVCHIGSGSRLMHHPSGGFHTTQSWHIGHYWITGLIYHYLLTGDMRTFNVVRDLGAGPLIKYRNARYTGRERTRMLFHLAELYDLTHLTCFRHAFETHYNYGKPTLAADYYGGSGLLALKRWYDATGESPYLERFITDAENVVKERPPDPARDVGSGRGWHIFSAMAEAARVTGDRQFIDAFHRRLVWYLVSVQGFDHSAVRGFEFMEAAQRLGIPEHESMPEHLVGIDIFTGLSAKFRMRVHDEKDEPFTMRVYRTRNFRASRRKTAPDALSYRVTRPDGTVAVDGRFAGTAYQTRRIDVPADGQRGDYAVDIDCIDGGQGAFSCSLPAVYLDSSLPLAFRRIRSAAGLAQFSFRAPRDTPNIRLNLAWRDMQGQGTGVWLEDSDGHVVARARWIVPLGFELDRYGQEVFHTDHLDLPVSESHRGQILTLTLTAAKWMKWQIEGLDEPWLAPTRRAFTEME
ncbi:MAG: hypothetical protein HN742_01820 [Lentisphaerae bacterium]|jgi:hypothetical protein|nr:hypothetical protein [Lentisphaerota bacterium]MBT4823351.1 hypothetical protein [Lentisphaerota bacterium]MBT5612345.1 hypothetical protein [Lentisphaerota bacterium]MBT7056649.1 hypothetical protein [Lentisphaerota bacterium]MBT7840574.1 hypothetical protein [Lentisphaerota bacterium]